MPKVFACQAAMGVLVATLLLGGSHAADAMPQPRWSSVVAVAEDPSDTPREIMPDQQWQRIVSGKGITLQDNAQVLVG